jgi:hypothetical protein
MSGRGRMKACERMGPPRLGELGMHLTAEEQVITASGRLTTPFPLELVCSSTRKTVNTIRRVDTWLIDNATIEAELRGNGFAARLFRLARNAPTTADKDCAEVFLFGTVAK